MTLEPEILEAAIEYQFRDRDLLRRALTHRSRAYELGAPVPSDDNEQLEFLGDSILGFLVSEWLVAHFPADAEGRLSKLKAHLVSATHLHETAFRMQLGQHLFLGKGEELSGGRAKKTLLANAIEALIAALYLDGGMEPARRFVVERLLVEARTDNIDNQDSIDFKGLLKERCQSKHLPPPAYQVVEERGPDHLKVFVMEVRVGKEWMGRGEGVSKKSAGQIAAKRLLEKWGSDGKSG